MGAFLWLGMDWISLSGVQLLVGIPAGIVFYFLLAYVLRMSSLQMLLSFVKKRGA